MEIFKRFELLVGAEGLEKLKRSKVIVFGLGGVGSYTAEGLVRSGIGHITLVDGDVVEESNFNRQLIATRSALGKFKVDVACNRFLEINPELKVEKLNFFYGTNTASLVNFRNFDYVVDAVDDLDAKVLIALNAFKLQVSSISAMSAGNKFNATGFEVADLFETSVCPIAKIMRRRLKALGVSKLKVIYSKEQARRLLVEKASGVIGSVSFVPPVVGFIMAGEVIKNILGDVF